jgi:KUP system potassium uptake protein
VVRALWNWNWFQAGMFLTLFIVVDFAFFSANLVKVFDGGWFPLVLGLGIFILFATWKRGRALLYEKLQQDSMPLDAFLASLEYGGPQRVAGTGIFITPPRRRAARHAAQPAAQQGVARTGDPAQRQYAGHSPC